MDPQTPVSQTKNLHLRLILISVLVICALLVFFLYSQNKSSTLIPQDNSVTAPTVADQVVSTTGSVSLLLVGGEEVLALDKPFEVDVVVNSAGNSVVGYDLVLSMNSTDVDVVKASSLFEDFTVYPSKKSDHYSVTAIKKLDSKEAKIFTNTPVLRLTLQPKKAGVLKISIVQRLGLEKTQMVNEQTQVLNPSVGEITLEIR